MKIEEEEMERKNKNQNTQIYMPIGLTIFLSLTAVILVYTAITKIDIISGVFGRIISAIQPIIIGLILAYLVSPLEQKFETFLLKKKVKAGKSIAVFSTALLILVLGAIAIGSLIPQVLKTILTLSDTLPGMLNSFLREAKNYLSGDSRIMEWLQIGVEKFNDWFQSWLQSGLYNMLSEIVSGVINVVGFLFNIVIGFIVMIYVLFERDHFRGQAKKILYAVSKNKKYNAFLLDTIRECDKMFGGFITGKLIDSLIVGILCFISMSILRFPYVALISLVVGVTNIIPFFGPYIGAIPSILLIFLVSPMKAVEFVIFTIILQQIDGNILGPKILGESIGVSAFWILFSILFFGELFGLIGMIIGVPLFATIYYVVKRLVEEQLAAQNLPIDSENYILLDKLDDKNQATFLSNNKTKKQKMKKKIKKMEKGTIQTEEREKDSKEQNTIVEGDIFTEDIDSKEKKETISLEELASNQNPKNEDDK